MSDCKLLFRISPAHAKAAKAEARKAHMPVSAWVRSLIAQATGIPDSLRLPGRPRNSD